MQSHSNVAVVKTKEVICYPFTEFSNLVSNLRKSVAPEFFPACFNTPALLLNGLIVRVPLNNDRPLYERLITRKQHVFEIPRAALPNDNVFFILPSKNPNEKTTVGNMNDVYSNRSGRYYVLSYVDTCHFILNLFYHLHQGKIEELPFDHATLVDLYQLLHAITKIILDKNIPKKMTVVCKIREIFGYKKDDVFDTEALMSTFFECGAEIFFNRIRYPISQLKNILVDPVIYNVVTMQPVYQTFSNHTRIEQDRHVVNGITYRAPRNVALICRYLERIPAVFTKGMSYNELVVTLIDSEQISKQYKVDKGHWRRYGTFVPFDFLDALRAAVLSKKPDISLLQLINTRAELIVDAGRIQNPALKYFMRHTIFANLQKDLQTQIDQLQEARKLAL